ncbi:hypothetical protein GCM10009430_17720 [Aquimarina litoralis]|uniref:Lipoprotein n=2 Tax=Aquimarina litoralis TaxID=584605 RepID=A0ABN1IQ65_9FLAO
MIMINGCKSTKIENLLEAPNTWRKEVLEFPLIFARSLPYKGEEHIRFAEGWGDVDDEDYFSYVFIWILEDDPDLTNSRVTSDMDTYFTGLMKTGLLTKLKFFKKLPKTKVTIYKSQGLNSMFEGKIEVYDAFFKREKIILNAKINSSYCNVLKKYIVYFRLSPKEFHEPIWENLQTVKIKYDCGGT